MCIFALARPAGQRPAGGWRAAGWRPVGGRRAFGGQSPAKGRQASGRQPAGQRSAKCTEGEGGTSKQREARNVQPSLPLAIRPDLSTVNHTLSCVRSLGVRLKSGVSAWRLSPAFFIDIYMYIQYIYIYICIANPCIYVYIYIDVYTYVY